MYVPVERSKRQNKGKEALGCPMMTWDDIAAQQVVLFTGGIHILRKTSRVQQITRETSTIDKNSNLSLFYFLHPEPNSNACKFLTLVRKNLEAIKYVLIFVQQKRCVQSNLMNQYLYVCIKVQYSVNLFNLNSQACFHMNGLK